MQGSVWRSRSLAATQRAAPLPPPPPSTGNITSDSLATVIRVSQKFLLPIPRIRVPNKGRNGMLVFGLYRMD